MVVRSAKLPDLSATAYGDEFFEHPGPFPVGRLNLKLRDRSRSTPPNGSFRGLPYRQLTTSVWYPARPGFSLAARAVAEGGPFPIVLYSHGFCSSRNEATRMAAHFASHGIILVAADFPLSSTLAKGGKPSVLDVANQAGDVSFLLHEMLSASAPPLARFRGAIDPERVGAAGISMGATTTLLATYHGKLNDARICAAVSIAGPTSMFDEAFFSREVPLLHIHGDRDALIYYHQNARSLLERTGPWARLLTVEGASHTGFSHIPLERFALKVLGAWFAPEGAHPDHADRLGCGVVLRALPKDLEFLRPLADVEHGIHPPEVIMPGARSILGAPAAPPDHQRRIAIHSSLAFFLSHFAPDPQEREDARRFLSETMVSREGVRLEVGRRPVVRADGSVYAEPAAGPAHLGPAQ